MFGPEVGVYLPTSSDLRLALGDQWWSVGVTTMREGATVDRQKLGTNISFVSQSKNGNSVFLASYTFGALVPLGSGRARPNDSALRPFFAARAGVSYIDYAVTMGLNRFSGKKVGYNANVEAGFMMGDRLTISARYDVFSKYDGFTFDGLSFNLRYGLVQF